MISFIIKSTLVLTISLLYYWIFLRKEKRFAFIRAYLLSTLVLAMLLATLNFNLGFRVNVSDTFIDTIHLNQKAFSTDQLTTSNIPVVAEPDRSPFSTSQILAIVYGIGFLLMAWRFIRGLLSVRNSIRNSKEIKYQGQNIYLSETANSPFSFWKAVIIPKDLFSNDQIDKDILIHEHAHTRSLHSLDIFLLELLVTLYWFNPMIWVYRKLIKENHEFDADQEVLNQNNDFKSYSCKIVELIKRKNNLILASAFNYSTIKNRIIMMKNEKSSGRIFSLKVLGSVAIIAMGVFTVSCYNDLESSSPADNNEFVVVLDVGHGGADGGVMANGLVEKDFTLSLAKSIRTLNTKSDIKFILSREDDSNVTFPERTDVAKRNNAQLLISLHLNENIKNTDANGLEIYYSNENPQASASKVFSSIIKSNSNFETAQNGQIKEGNFFICRKTECPAVLLELGFATNDNDAKVLQSEGSLDEIARNIISSVASFKEQSSK